MKGIARAGRGSAIFIADNERMQSKVRSSIPAVIIHKFNNISGDKLS